jgi:hypothetical protein
VVLYFQSESAYFLDRFVDVRLRTPEVSIIWPFEIIAWHWALEVRASSPDEVVGKGAATAMVMNVRKMTVKNFIVIDFKSWVLVTGGSDEDEMWLWRMRYFAT